MSDMKRIHHFSPRAQHAGSRRGAFIVVVMVCLLVAGMLVASLLKLALLQDRQLVYEQARLQAAWLAEAGLDRAAGRLAREPAYAGETWDIDADQLGGGDAAAVVIRVQIEETRPQQRTIVVEAHFPAEGPYQARLTRETTVILSKES
ncbi:MAG: hypothetical protein ACM3U2_03835 [Deltaproteobacteria bacterium]